MREGSLEPRALETRGAVLLGVSAQGSAALLTESKLFTGMFAGTVSILPVAGGGTREINRAALAADFAGDDSSLCLVTLVKSNLFQLEWPQGEILLAPATSPLRSPRVRGTQVAYFHSTPATIADGEILVLARGGKPRRLARCKGFTSLAWGPDRKEIWFSTYDGGESSIQAVSLRGGTRLLARHPGYLELMDVDPAGRCLAISSSQMRQAFGRAPGTDREVDLTWLDAQTPSGLRADGSQVLLARSEDWELSDDVDLYLRSLAGGPAIRLGTGSIAADLSPDGKWVATFETNDRGQAGIRLIPTGAGASRWYPLAGPSAHSDELWFHPLGGSIDLMEEDTNTSSRLDLATGTVSPGGYPRPVGTTYGQYPRSPDGRRMLLTDNQATAQSEDSLFQFMLFEGEGMAPRPAKGNVNTEVVAGWADNNQEVYLYDRNTTPVQVFRWNPLTGGRRPLFQITPSDPSGVWGIRNLTITPSGRAYVYSVVRKLSDLYLIEGLK